MNFKVQCIFKEYFMRVKSWDCRCGLNNVTTPPPWRVKICYGYRTKSTFHASQTAQFINRKLHLQLNSRWGGENKVITMLPKKRRCKNGRFEDSRHFATENWKNARCHYSTRAWTTQTRMYTSYHHLKSCIKTENDHINIITSQ